MTVTVGPGLGWIKADEYWGVNAYEPNPTTFTINTADGELERYDTICIQYNKNVNDGGLVYKQGSYLPQPPTPALPVRDLDFDEIVIWAIHVRGGATTITQEDVIDLRLDENYCGLMRDGVTRIPTQALYDQWMSWFINHQADAQQYFANYQQMVVDLYIQFQAEMAVRGQNADAVYDAYVDRINAYEFDQKAEWEAWVATLKDILDEQVAGNHELRIEALEERVPTADLGTINTEAATSRLYPSCGLFVSSWAFGIGGAGVGPAGGTSVQSVDAGYLFDEHDVTVSAPLQYQAFTNINQLSSTLHAFLSDSITETQSLVLRIYD